MANTSVSFWRTLFAKVVAAHLEGKPVVLEIDGGNTDDLRKGMNDGKHKYKAATRDVTWDNHKVTITPQPDGTVHLTLELKKFLQPKPQVATETYNAEDM